MTKYFKSSRGNYNAVSETPIPYEGSYRITEKGADVYPTATVNTEHYPASFTPYWDESTPTGLSQQFHDLLFDEHMDSDPFKVADRATGVQPVEVMNSLMNIQNDQMLLDDKYDPEDVKTVQEKFHPPALFHYEPERLKIDGAFAHQKMAHTVPVMLQMAKQDYPHATMVASEDLSPYSSKLSRNAHARGLVEPHPENRSMRVTNDMGFDDANTVRSYLGSIASHHEEVPETRVRQAKNELRQTLRQNSPKKNMSPQFDHPTLFDI